MYGWMALPKPRSSQNRRNGIAVSIFTIVLYVPSPLDRRPPPSFHASSRWQPFHGVLVVEWPRRYRDQKCQGSASEADVNCLYNILCAVTVVECDKLWTRQARLALVVLLAQPGIADQVETYRRSRKHQSRY